MFRLSFVFLLFTSSLFSSVDWDVLSEEIDEARRDMQVSGVCVGVMAEGKVIFSKGFGEANIETKKPVTSDTVFAIGSCTKAFTSLSIGQLVEKGALQWDGKVCDILPWFRLQNQQKTYALTISDILANRTGIFRHDLVWYGSPLTQKEVVMRLRHLPEKVAHCHSFTYNNILYASLGLIVEAVTKKPWGEYVHEHIFRPLHMNDTSISLNEKNVATGYKEKDGMPHQVPYRDIQNIAPAGSIYSTVSDMLKWLCLYTTNENHIVKKSTLDTILREHVPIDEDWNRSKTRILGYGMGWVLQLYDTHFNIMHTGGIDGFRSMVSVLPDDKVAVVVLTNSENADPLCAAIVSSVFDRVLKTKPTPHFALAKEQYVEQKRQTVEKFTALLQKQVVNTVFSHNLRDYVGDYWHQGYGKAAVSLSDNTLFVRYNSFTLPLQHYHYDQFIVAQKADTDFQGMIFQFETDVEGKISHLMAPFEAECEPIVLTRIM